jgi:hypothetical protein
MPRANFHSETDGFAFVNDWTWDATETAILTNLVTDALGVIEVILSPFIIAAEGPVLAAELGVPFIGPWLVAKTIEAENNAIVNAIVGAITPGHYGLCGGMAFASLDYWHKNWIVPRGTGPNDQPQRTSPTGTALRDYIWNRLLKSIEDNVGTFLQWMAVLHFEGGPGASWLRDQTGMQVAILKSRIDTGTPVTVGLVGTSWNPMENHQVLIYGYQNNSNGTVSLFAYDNNHPDTETTYVMDFSGSQLVVNGDTPFGDGSGPMRGLFCTTYSPATPPRAVVLRAGVTESPALTGINKPVQVAMTVANIGYHASPPMTLTIGSNFSAPVHEAAAASLAEGATRAINGNLSFASPGHPSIAGVAMLTAHGGVQVTKFLPPEGATQSPSTAVTIVNDRIIDVVTSTTCQITNVAGGQATFKVEVADMGSGLQFHWTVTGATVLSGAGTQQITVQLPAAVGASYTLAVTVTRPDGGSSGGSMTLQTISSFAAGLEQVMCEISHIMTQPPFQLNPGDPGPDGQRVVNPGDIAALGNAAAAVVNAANAAAKLGTPVTLGSTPAVRLTINPATLGGLAGGVVAGGVAGGAAGGVAGVAGKVVTP